MSNGKQKGGAFERDVCRKLSLWVSGGKQSDLFWRSAMSGGRATVARNRGESVRQAGDITAVAPEGHILTDKYYVECKFYKDLDILSFILNNKGKLAGFWKDTKREADRHGDRYPMLIAKQNNTPALFIVPFSDFSGRAVNIDEAFIFKFDDVLKDRRFWKWPRRT